MHRDHHAGQNQRGVELTAQHSQRVEELHKALEGQVLGLDRDDHAVGGDQGVYRDRAQRWRRAVEEREREAIADGPQPVPQTALVALDSWQLDRGAGKIAGGLHEPEVVRARGAGAASGDEVSRRQS